MPGTTPAVETVIRRGEMRLAEDLERVAHGIEVEQRLAHAHEDQVEPSAAAARPVRAARTWPTISPAVRLRPAPQKPVTQKAHASAQPAWLERQSVRRVRSGMSTASIEAPSASRSRYLVVPSSESRRSLIAGRATEKRSASARAQRGRRGRSWRRSRRRAGGAGRRRSGARETARSTVPVSSAASLRKRQTQEVRPRGGARRARHGQRARRARRLRVGSMPRERRKRRSSASMRKTGSPGGGAAGGLRAARTRTGTRSGSSSR